MELYADFFFFRKLECYVYARTIASYTVFLFVPVGLTFKLCVSAKAYSPSTNLPHGAGEGDGS